MSLVILCYTSFKYLIGEKEVVTMSPASKAQQKAVNKYMKKNYDRVNLVMPKGRKDAIRTHAEKNGESLNTQKAFQHFSLNWAENIPHFNAVPLWDTPSCTHSRVCTLFRFSACGLPC